jgi:ABC-2 type transport system permease protein
MKTMKWLVRREFWEHKGSIFWAPVVVGGLMVLFIGASLMYAIGAGMKGQGRLMINGQQTQLSMVFSNMPLHEQQAVIETISGAYFASSAPLFLMLSVIAFFYCLGALYDERRDRSILFWKSLPVSDQQTVLSKAITAACVAPLITIAVASFTSMLLLLIACSALALNGVNLFGAILSSPRVYLAPLQIVGLLPIYALWALPTIGWLLMVSAWARSKVFLWAVGTPIIMIVIIKWVQEMLGLSLNADWLIQNVIARGLAGLIPGIWLPLERIAPELLVGESDRIVDLGNVFVQSWLTLASPSVWLGAAAGAGMIFAAMRLRRWKDEG